MDHVGARALDARERKLATVLFADLAGSTALAERLDIEPLEQIMASFRRVVTQSVERCGGHAEFVGDAVVAVFGAPVAVENHQHRAVEAADLILEGIDGLNLALGRHHDVTLGIRIGINTGEVLVDTRSELHLGQISSDTFNVAARLQQAASVGEVLVAERTFRALPGRAHDDLGPLQVAGRERPVRTVRLLRRNSEAQSAAEPPAPLVGRSGELARLRRELEEVVDTRRSRLVTMVGEAGIGKSTVLGAFLGELSRHGIVQVAVGGCRHFGKEGPFDPLTRVLSSLPTDMSSHSAIRAFLGPGGERHATTLARALGMEGVDSDSPGQTSQDVTAAWRALVGRLTSERPLVLAVEDVHCADPEVLDLISAGLSVPGRGLLVVATARPDPEPCGGDGWPPEGAVAIPIGPLDEADTSELACRIEPALGDIPGAGTRIHVKTEGNPFFVVELVRSISEHGNLVGLHSGDISDLGVPDSVQGVLADRIDRLGHDDKQVLQAAAVVGRDFSAGAIRPLLHGIDLDETLERLVAKSMIEPVDAETTTYRFVHALTRDVAYATIPRRTLHGLHESVADWIERHPLDAAGDVASLVAFHLSQACRSAEADWSAPPEHRSEVKRKWVRWTIEAARHATAAAAYTEARRLAREAIAEAGDEGQLVDALECLGNIHFFNYEGDGAWRCLTEAADRAQGAATRTPGEIAGMNIRALQAALRWTGGMSQAPTTAELDERITMVEHLLEPGDGPDRVRLLTCIGFWPFATVGRAGTDLIGIDEARRAAESAAGMAQRLGRADLHSAALDSLASSFIFRGEYAGADAITERRLDLYEDLTDPWEQGDLCAMGGWIAFQRARYSEAEEWTTRGIVEFAEYPSIGLHCRAWRGVARLRNGDWDGLLADAAVVERAFTAGPPAPYMTPVIAAAAFVHHLRGDEEASDRLIRLLAGFETLDPPHAGEPVLARWAEYLAPIVCRRGDPRAALDLIDADSNRRRSRLGQLLTARAIVVVDGRCWGEADATIDACRRQAVAGGTPIVTLAAEWVDGSRLAAAADWDGAVGAFQRALAAAGEPDAWLTGRINLGLAEALLALSRPEGDSRAATAASTFERLGSAPETTELRALLARFGWSSDHRRSG